MQSPTPEQLSPVLKLVESGGPFCIVIGVLTIAIIVLWKWVGLPFMDRQREISNANQIAMGDLKQATQNSKDSINAATIATAQANHITEQLRMELAGQQRR